jgi:PTS system N-acetylglucosamine-specific IIC component
LVGGLLLSLALTSFLTGVTEPIEFTFMFLAPLLYAVHAVLTGLSMVLMDALGVRLGFTFSAGLFDYLINFSASSRPWLLLPVGALYFAVYYSTFAFCIRRFDLKTPGRESAAADTVEAPVAGGRAEELIAALGGVANLRKVDACTTRLRLELANLSAIDEARLTRAGSRGIVRPGGSMLQVVLGPIADQVAGEMRAVLAAPTGAAGPSAKTVLEALGGRANIAGIEPRASRICITLADGAALDRDRLLGLGFRGVAFASPTSVHLIAGPDAPALSVRLEALLA